MPSGRKIRHCSMCGTLLSAQRTLRQVLARRKEGGGRGKEEVDTFLILEPTSAKTFGCMHANRCFFHFCCLVKCQALAAGVSICTSVLVTLASLLCEYYIVLYEYNSTNTDICICWEQS